MHVERSTTVRASQREVWECVTDRERQSEWLDAVADVGFGTGDRGTDRTPHSERDAVSERAGGVTRRIREWEPPHRYVEEGMVFGGPALVTIEVVPLEDAAGPGAVDDTLERETRLRLSADLYPLARFRPAGWVLENAVLRWRVAATLDARASTVKESVEAEVADRSALERVRGRLPF